MHLSGNQVADLITIVVGAIGCIIGYIILSEEHPQ